MFDIFKNLWGVLMGTSLVRRNVLELNADGVVNSNENIVLVDASQNHVIVTLPPSFDFHGELYIVCVDATHGIEIVPNSGNVLFDASSVAFHAKGDALTLVSDDSKKPGTWYIVGRYAASWFA
jgi:hypothetical protein